MRRVSGILLVALLSAGVAACGVKAAPRTTPTPPTPPPPPGPPPALAARSFADWLPAWPPEIEPTSVAALLLEEEPGTAAPGPAPEPDRPTEPPPVPAAEPPRLTTPGTPDDVAATRQVNDTLDRARRALATLRYDRLTSDARAQYDTVSQLIQQAEEALRARNFVFALKVADKADTLARRLSERAA
jgi:hypothetical protein